jgi:serine/threonine protein kinase
MDTVKMNPPMPEENKCPQCGTPLPSGALAGLCPACLLKMGAAKDTVTGAKQPPFNPPSVAELAPLFPQLEILELIGKGGMGAVYKARQKQLDRIVALKILPPGIGDDPAFAERFAREAKALAKLNHPNIVTLYEFGEASGQFYFLMEFVDGVNLRQLLHAGRISAREALAIVPQICDALQFAHDQGIVHRDIKPENILLDRRGRVKVADFGLAKIVENRDDAINFSATGKISGNLTDTGKAMGTPNYMSPEQITAPGEVDHRADIYALGVVFYQMLTGELPGKKIAPPSTKVQIDVRLDEIVLRALEKNPGLRYQQVSEVKTLVETIGSSGSAGVPAAPVAALSTGTAINKSKTVIGWALVILSLIVGLYRFGQTNSENEYEERNLNERWNVTTKQWFDANDKAFQAQTALNFFEVTNQTANSPETKREIGRLNTVLEQAKEESSSWQAALGEIGNQMKALPMDNCLHNLFLPAGLLIAGLLVLLARRSKPPGCVTDSAGVLPAEPTRKNSTAKIIAIGCGVLGSLALAITVVLLLSAYFKTAARPEVHYLVFEVDRALVDQLVPVAQRQIGATGNWQMADINPATFAALLDGRVLNKHMMIDRHLEIPKPNSSKTYVTTEKPGVKEPQQKVIIGWPVVTDSVGYLRENDVSNDIVQVSGSGFFGVRKKDDGLQLKLEYDLTHKIADRPAVDVNIAYEGKAPENGVLAFIIPFARKDDTTGCYIFAVEVLAEATKASLPSGNIITGPPFVARLNQAEVELVAVGNMPWTNPVCWLPNGQPSTEPFPTGYGSVEQWSDTMDVKKIAFRIHSRQPDAISAPVFRCDPASGASGASSVWSAPDWRTHNGYLAQIIVCPKDTATMNVSLGVANGAWETAATLEHQNNLGGAEADGDWSATWSAVVGSNGDVAINCSYATSTNWETRMVDVDDVGKLTVIPKNSSSVSTLSTGGILLVSSNEFERIKEFQLQRRKYQWVEFRNVSLQPGYQTTVEVKDFGDENQVALTKSTVPDAAQNLSFGPVIERVVNLVGDTNHAIDLNSGRFVVLPTFEESTNQETNENDSIEAFEFDEKNSVDAEGAVEIPLMETNGSFAPLPITEKLNGLACESGTFALQIEVSNWDSAPADWVAEHARNIKPVWDTCHMSGMGNLPKVYLFKTREGSLGILQITGFIENPRGVKIRYKLVQDGNANTPSSQNAASVGQDYIAISNSTLPLPSGTTATSIPITLATSSVGVDYTVVTSGTAPFSYQWFFLNTNPPAAQNLFFGPVTKCTIYDYKSGKDWLLNLATGETFSLPPSLNWKKNSSAVLEWLHENGVHVMGFTVFSQNWHEGDLVPAIVVLNQGYGMPVASKRGLYGFEMQAAIMQAQGLTFANITPLQISNTLQKLVVPAKGNNIGPFLPQFSGMAWHDTAWQGTDDYLYVFQTDDGQSGVLQITGFTENPRSVRIRYKLVQTNSSAEKTTQMFELQQAQIKLAEAKNEYGANSSEASRQQRIVDKIASATGDEKAARNVCIGNLRQIDAAKDMWALEFKKQKGDVPTIADLLPYLSRNRKFPICPDGGNYIINAIGEAPTCSLSGHAIPNYKP